MKKQTVILRNLDILDRVLTLCRRAVDDEKDHEIIIRERKVDRSLAQNSLYWKWVSIAGPDFGYTSDEMHDEFRIRFLAKIYEANPDRHPALIETLRNLRIVARENKQLGLALHRQYILGAISTTDASVKEFTEYLDRIDKHSAENDVRLPLPADIGLDEMAWKR